MEKKSKKIVLSLCLMLLAFVSVVHANPVPENNSTSPVFDTTLPLASPALSCAAESTAAPGTEASVLEPHFYGYCYYDCSPCWSGYHGADCPFNSACTSIPLC